MENMVLTASFWKHKRVFVTGHTGFKGSWLCLWLHSMGAKVSGFSIGIPTQPSLFESIVAKDFVENHTADIRDCEILTSTLHAFAPDIVFHFAAQPLVRASYQQPLETFSSNVLGTASLLEACRGVSSVQSVVVATTDKVYENNQKNHAYLENETLGGKDPYSASKACAEMVVRSYRNSFFKDKHPSFLTTVRAGNIIGGGDWSSDRLIPDAVRSFQCGEPIVLRYPNAVRPWQHVADAVRGYLMVAQASVEQRITHESFNLGPSHHTHFSVRQVMDSFVSLWGGKASWQSEEHVDTVKRMEEADFLCLNSERAYKALGWKANIEIEQALRYTSDWYKAFYRGESKDVLQKIMLDQMLRNNL